jgi:hypothetical protein
MYIGSESQPRLLDFFSELLRLQKKKRKNKKRKGSEISDARRTYMELQVARRLDDPP